MGRVSSGKKEDLKIIVKNFRNAELRSLLSFANRSAVGRKSELLDRVYELIENGVQTSLNFRISEIHGKRNFPQRKSDRKSPAVEEASTSFQTLATDTSDVMSNNSSPKSCSYPVHDQLNLHEYCPNIKFKSLPFYDQTQVLIKPSILKSNSAAIFNSFSYMSFQFHLSSQHCKLITESQELINDCMLDYKVQVVLRFCVNIAYIDQDDNTPNMLRITVNGKSITLPVSTTTIGFNEVKRPAQPIDITHACDLTPGALNSVTIGWMPDICCSRCFTVVLSKHLSCVDLLKKLKSNSLSPAELTKALIKEKLATSMDNEISTTCLKISLVCPLGKVRLNVPARSSACKHLQCFDAQTFIQMNEKKATWICPICDKPAKFETLVIDGLFLDILSKVQDSNEIQFFEDGSWKSLNSKGKSCVMPSESVTCFDVPDSPSSSDSGDTIVLGESLQEGKQISKRREKNTSVTMIDLTGDSDDDDDDVDEVVPCRGQRSLDFWLRRN